MKFNYDNEPLSKIHLKRLGKLEIILRMFKYNYNKKMIYNILFVVIFTIYELILPYLFSRVMNYITTSKDQQSLDLYVMYYIMTEISKYLMTKLKILLTSSVYEVNAEMKLFFSITF